MSLPNENRQRPGRPRTDAKERILQAAVEILVTDGYGGLTTQKVADLSGANKALISYHFGSKDGLVDAVASQMSQIVVAQLEDAFAAEGPIEELVSGAVDNLWEFFHRTADVQRIYLDLLAQSISQRSLRDILGRTRNRFVLLVVERLEQEMGGHLTARQREALATYFMAISDGLAIELLLSGDSDSLTDTVAMFKKTAVTLLDR